MSCRALAVVERVRLEAARRIGPRDRRDLRVDGDPLPLGGGGGRGGPVEARGHRLAQVPVEEQPVRLRVQVEVQAEEAQVEVLREFQPGVVLDRRVGGAADPGIPVDRAVDEGRGAVGIGPDDRQDQALDVRRAQEVVLVRDEGQPVARRRGVEDERAGPDRAILEVEVRVGGGHRVDRPIGERDIDRPDPGDHVAHVGPHIEDAVGRVGGTPAAARSRPFGAGPPPRRGTARSPPSACRRRRPARSGGTPRSRPCRGTPRPRPRAGGSR